MTRVIRTIAFSTVLPHHLKDVFLILLVAATPRIVRVGSTHQKGVVRLLGKNSDVVVTIVLRLAFDQTEFRVAMPRVPSDPLLRIFFQTI